MSILKRLIVPLIIVALLAAAAVTMLGSEDRKHLTAAFPRTVSVYEGSDVRVLGVPVGQVESVEPDGTSVKVRMSYDAEVQLPADAQAVIIAPSVVGDRFVQLTPAFSGGEALADDATLDMTRTSTPLELDEVYQSIDELTVALGPDGANSDGALTELLRVTADNFEGEGEQFHQTIQDLGKLTGTLENNKEELFGTAAELERFVKALADNDQVVRDFNASMSAVSELLAGEREELAASLEHLGVAMTQVRSFVSDNREVLSRNIKGLNRFSDILVKRREELKEILNVAPLALNNLALTYNPQEGTLDTAGNTSNAEFVATNDPALFLCSVILTADPTGAGCDAAEALLNRPGYGPSAVTDSTFGRLLEVAR